MTSKLKALAFIQKNQNGTNPDGLSTRRTTTKTGGKSPATTLVAVLAFVALALCSATAWATTINPGDMVIVDAAAFNGSGAIILVTPGGTQTVVSCNPGSVQGSGPFTPCPVTTGPGLFQEPAALAIEVNGKIVVADRISGVFRVDATTGVQSSIHSGPPFVDTFGIAVEADGNILVTDTGCPTHNCSTGGFRAQAVYRVNPVLGTVTVVSQRTAVPGSSHLDSPYGIAVEDSGNIVVTDATSNIAPFTGAGGIIRMTPAGVESAVSVGTAGSDGCPFGIAVEPINGKILNSLLDPGAFPGSGYGCSPGSIWHADPLVFDQNAVLSPHSIGWQAPFGMDADISQGVANYTILIVDEFHAAVFRIGQNGVLIAPIPISSHGFLITPTDIAVYNQANTPPSLTGPDLSVSKTDNTTTVTAGDGVTRTYTITVTNNSLTQQATGVTVTDAWPTGFTRGTLPAGCTTTTGSNFSCSLGNLAANTSATISVSYTVPATTPPGPQINSATVSSGTTDPVSANNSGSDETTVVTNADLSIAKTDNTTTVTAGDGITRTYTITVHNNGPSQALAVTVNDAWPTGFTRGTLPAGCTQTVGSNFTCSLGNLAPGATATISVSYTVPSTTPPGAQTNSVTVNSNTPDGSMGNNNAEDINTVNAPPPPSADLKMDKTDSADPVNTGASFSYNLAVTNLGPNTAVNLTVTDTLPAGVTFVSATGAGWTCNPPSGGTVTCTRPSLDVNTPSSITINVTAPPSPGAIVNSATVTSSTGDLHMENNTDSETTTISQPPQPPAKWTGGGQIPVPNGKANFGFNVERTTTDGPVSGQLEYYDHVRKVNVRSLSIQTLTVVGNKATFTGTAEESVNGGPRSGSYNFTVTVEDFGEPGTNDTFKIQVTDPSATVGNGTPISSGNIQQH